MLIAFVSVVKVTAQKEVIFKQIKIEDGLSQSSIFCMLQDSKGYLWFGTANGLNRYDGYNFLVFSNNPTDSNSISDNGILALHEDKDGYIWIGTVEGILNRYDRKTGVFKRYNLTEQINKVENPSEKYYDFPLPFSRNNDNTITSIADGKNNNLWIGTWGKGLVSFNKKTLQTTSYHYRPENSNSFHSTRVKTIIPDDNYIWVGTLGGGLYRINENINKISLENFTNDYRNKSSLSDDRVISLCKDNAGNLWIGTYGGGLNKLAKNDLSKNSSNTRFINYKHDVKSNSLTNDIVTAIIQDKSGWLWLGTYGGGLDRFNPTTKEFINFKNDPVNTVSLNKNDVMSIYEDASGTIWVGTHLGKGLNKIERITEKFSHISRDMNNINGLNDDVVWSIYEDKDSHCWIGTYKGGLNLWDRKKNRFEYFKFNPANARSIGDNHVRAITDDGFGNLLIGTYNGGLNIMNKSSKTFRRFVNYPNDTLSLGANQVQSVYLDNEKNIWIGTFGGGLNKINAADYVLNDISFQRFTNDKNNPFSISDNRIYTIYEDRDGMMWIGTFGGGLNKFDRINSRFISYQNIQGDATSISDNRVMAIFEDSQGSLWVGTYGGGLNKFDRRNEKFIRYNESNNLISSVVYAVLEDKFSNLWMSTDNGLFKLNISSGNFTRYDLHDGLQSLEFSGGAYFKSSNDEMFFGGINGFNYFYPDSIHDNYFVPPIVLSTIKVFNNSVKGEYDTLYISYDQNFISFEFAALDYTNPPDNQYAYMLEGFDENWHYVDSRGRIANYTNLSPGEYTFKVRGSNNDGIWNNIGAQVHLIISPPFWRTWWFILISIVIAGLIIYYLSTIRYRNLLTIEKLKAKLSADLHDNVGSGLTEISILSELASHQGNQNASQHLNTISDKARLLIDNMSEIVWMVNPQRDSLYHLILRLKDSYSDFMHALDISFATVNIEKFSDIRLPMDYKQNLYLIFKEGINNAIKHSKCKKITLEANFTKEHLELILRDDGIGIDTTTIKFGNGIQNMKRRAKIIGGNLDVISSENGTSLIYSGRITGLKKIISIFKK